MTATLLERAHCLDYFGSPQRVIEDEPLLSWACQANISPPAAQMAALREGIIPLRYLKNLTALKLSEQRSICAGRVLVCGCGGLGGIIIQLLARAGVGHLRVVDGDVFYASNLNRQLLSNVSNLSHSKALIAARETQKINPLIRVEPVNLIMEQRNAAELVRDNDLVLDALDNLAGRFLLAESAREEGIPFIHAAVAGWWGQISTFMPHSSCDLKSVYGGLRSRDPAEEATGVLGPSAAIIGSLEALEAMRLLAGKNPVYCDKLLYFDGESGQTELIPLACESTD